MSFSRYFSYQDFLRDELCQRKQRNPYYSLGAFARDLGLRSSRLSEIINGKVGISKQKAAEIAEKMRISEEEKLTFIQLVRTKKTVEKSLEQLAMERLHQRKVDEKPLRHDEFSEISDWYYLAYLELMKTSGYNDSIDYAISKLGIAHGSAQEMMDRLLALNLVQKSEARLNRVHKRIVVPLHVPSEAAKKYLRQILDRSQKAISSQSFQGCDFSTVNFAVQKSQIPALKHYLQKIRTELITEFNNLSSQDSNDTVYCFSMQLFELIENAEKPL